MTDTTPRDSVSSEGKTIAVISYLTIIGTIVALVNNMDKKDPFGWFHIRQMIGLGLCSIGVWILSMIPILGLLMLPVGLGFIVLWVIGLLSAINGKATPVPIFGEHYQEWFAGMK